MYEIFIKTHFSAAHRLTDYPGNCARFHGHNWEVCVYVTAEKLNDSGMAFDFRELKRMLNEVLAELDHADLNQVSALKGLNPTCEIIARHIYDGLTAALSGMELQVSRVKVNETPNCGVIYSGSR